MRAKHERAISQLGMEIKRLETARLKAKEDADKAEVELKTATERYDTKVGVLTQSEQSIRELQDTIDTLRLEQERPD